MHLHAFFAHQLSNSLAHLTQRSGRMLITSLTNKLTHLIPLSYAVVEALPDRTLTENFIKLFYQE